MGRRVVLIVLALHALGAGAWFWLMPGGWPAGAARFWVNQVWPLAMIAAGLAGIAGLATRRDRLVAAIALGFAAQWVGAAAAALVVFPASGAWVAVRAVPVLLVMGAMLIPWRASLRRWHVAPAVLGLVVGAALLRAQRAPLPATRPLGDAAPAVPADAVRSSSVLELGPGVRFAPATGAIRVQAGSLALDVAPLLSFLSRSPDGGWVVFAAARDRSPPPRALERVAHHDGDAIAAYTDGVLQVAAHDATDITAFTRVAEATYSHLNTFAQLVITGHERLSVAFSPAPDARIAFTHAEYPTGKPATFACLGADGVFRVLRAADGEKGPFTELAAGLLARGAPLSFVLYDGDRPIARVTLDDWTAQLDTRASPTAGWGVPVNAIELALSTDDPRSTAEMFITLAATSVGRGFDSVGHAPGVYRDRIRVERLR